MMVELLAGHTSMNVRQATDGMLIERDHLYVIPPGTYLSVGNGALHLSQRQARHGTRLPFDFLLHSLAEEYGTRAICVVLSGTGADGSLGLKVVKEKNGLVIAQDPDEASYDGMPRNAIMTGAVDLVLPVAKIPEALVKYGRRMVLSRKQNNLRPQDVPRSSISCARKPAMISGFTSRARCGAGSSGAWRWRRSRPMTWIDISNCSATTQASSVF
jgi:two-component system CheB/CheR fusion protein